MLSEDCEVFFVSDRRDLTPSRTGDTKAIYYIYYQFKHDYLRQLYFQAVIEDERLIIYKIYYLHSRNITKYALPFQHVNTEHIFVTDIGISFRTSIDYCRWQRRN